jgi:hypothetical protein
MDWRLRLAGEDDIPALEALIPISVRALQAIHYSPAQMEAALGTVFGVDRQLIRDGTYSSLRVTVKLLGAGVGASATHFLEATVDDRARMPCSTPHAIQLA